MKLTGYTEGPRLSTVVKDERLIQVGNFEVQMQNSEDAWAHNYAEYRDWQTRN